MLICERLCGQIGNNIKNNVPQYKIARNRGIITVYIISLEDSKNLYAKDKTKKCILYGRNFMALIRHCTKNRHSSVVGSGTLPKTSGVCAMSVNI